MKTKRAKKRGQREVSQPHAQSDINEIEDLASQREKKREEGGSLFVPGEKREEKREKKEICQGESWVGGKRGEKVCLHIRRRRHSKAHLRSRTKKKTWLRNPGLNPQKDT